MIYSFSDATFSLLYRSLSVGFRRNISFLLFSSLASVTGCVPHFLLCEYEDEKKTRSKEGKKEEVDSVDDDDDDEETEEDGA